MGDLTAISSYNRLDTFRPLPAGLESSTHDLDTGQIQDFYLALINVACLLRRVKVLFRCICHFSTSRSKKLGETRPRPVVKIICDSTMIPVNASHNFSRRINQNTSLRADIEHTRAQPLGSCIVRCHLEHWAMMRAPTARS